MYKKLHYKIIISALAIVGLAFLLPISTTALSIFMPVQGGTGTSTPPTYGKVLLGNNNGTYDVVATSSLGFGAGAAIGGAVTSGTPSSILYVGGTSAAPTFAQNPQYFQYDPWTSNLQVTSTLGAEIVSGTWTLASGWTGHTTAGPWTHASDGTGTVSKTVGVIDPAIGNLYLITFSISSWTVGSVSITWGGVTLVNPVDGTTTFKADGTYNVRMKATATTNSFVITPTNTARLAVSLPSVKKLSGGTIRTGYLDIWQSASNNAPGTTRHISLNNDGSSTYIDANFAGVYKTGLGFQSTGQINSYHTGAYGWNWYTGYITPSLFSQNTPATFYHIGDGRFGGSVGAGSTNAPTSILQTNGSLGLQPTHITTNTTLDGTYTEVFCDGASNFTCTGTPTNPCAGSANQTACELYSRGCTWNAGSSCSAFDYEAPSMSTCGSTSGCSVATSACSGGDEASCLANDDSYGGSCAWAPITACTWSDPDCSGDATCDAGDNTDQSTCEAITYGGCSGSYNTGSCTGIYGTSCSGTASCSPISQANCSAAGCTGSTGATLTMPASPPDGRTYTITNVATTSAMCVLSPNTGQTIDFGSNYNLADYKQSVVLGYAGRTTSCSVFASAGTCTPSGCTVNNSACTWDGGMSDCSGNASCDAADATDQATCEAITYFSSCSGTYYLSKNWQPLATRNASTTFVTEVRGPIFTATSTTASSTFPWLSSTRLAISSLTTPRIPYSGAGGFLLDSSNLTWDNANKSLQVGTADVMTIHGANIVSGLEVNSDILGLIEFDTHSNTASFGAATYGVRSRGTTASRSVVQSGDTVRLDAAVAYDGTDYEQLGYTSWFVDGTPGSNDMPGRWQVGVTPDGGFTPAIGLTLKNNLWFGVGTTSPFARLSVHTAAGDAFGLSVGSTTETTMIDWKGKMTVASSTAGIVKLASGVASKTGVVVDKDSLIFLTNQGACTGFPSITATTSASFTVTSSNLADTCIVAWHIIQKQN